MLQHAVDAPHVAAVALRRPVLVQQSDALAEVLQHAVDIIQQVILTHAGGAKEAAQPIKIAVPPPAGGAARWRHIGIGCIRRGTQLRGMATARNGKWV